jgi:hypothetical protein
VAVLIGVGLALTAACVATGTPVPDADDAWFKSPAAELATRGALASPSLTGFFPRVHELFAAYPPLPQLILAGFFAVFGVSVRTAIFCAMLAHLACAVGITRVARRLLDGFSVSPGVRWWAPLVAGLCWLPAVRLLDRPEAFGLAFLWLDLAAVGPRSPWLRAARSGLWVGLAALCAPWAGLLGALTLGGRALTDAWVASPSPGAALANAAGWIAVGGALSATLFGSWIGVIEVLRPGLFAEQFLGAMRWADVFEPFPQTLGLYVSAVRRSLLVHPWTLPAFLVTAAWFPIAARGLDPADGPAAAACRRLAWVLYLTALVGLTLGLLRRPFAYTYASANLQFALPCLALVVARFAADREHPTVGRALPAALVGLAWLFVVKSLGAWAALPASERLDGAYAALREVVPAGEPVMVTSRHWQAFQGRNPWRDAIFLYKRDPSLLADCDWMVLRTGAGADQPDFVDQFELVAQVPTRADDDATYAWAVWRRK